jgi:hypothetical protein
VNRDNFRKIGRKVELCNPDILNILRAVYTSHKPLSPTDIARIASGDNPNIKKFSNEYKVIKKLCPSFKDLPGIADMRARRFLKVTLKPKIEKLLSEADREFKQAEHTMKEASRVYNHSTSAAEDAEIKLITDRYELAERHLSKIKDDVQKRGRKDWRYGPIFRGLLLYVYCECKLVLWEKNSNKWERRESNRYIRRILSNPLVIQEAPFLLFWEDFNKYGFNVINLLKQIAGGTS